MNNSYFKMHVKLWVKIILTLFSFWIFAKLWIHYSQIVFTIKILFFLVGILLFTIFTYITSIKFDKFGITFVYGITLFKRFYGYKEVNPWHKIKIGYFDYYFVPTVAVNSVPRFWNIFFTNYRKCMYIIAKYGMESVVKDTDKAYFEKFLFEMEEIDSND